MSAAETMRRIGRPIAYHPALAKHVGGVNAAIFLCQLIYWDGKTDDDLGVYKTAGEWEVETGLSYREQAGARKKLRDLGLIIETNLRLKHRIYYKLDNAAFNGLFDSVSGGENIETRESTKAHFPNDESAIGGQPKAQLGDNPKRNSLITTKTTTETTAEITTAAPMPAQAPAVVSAPKKADLDFSSWPAKPNPEVWRDYKTLRSQKRAPITQTVINRMATELHKAGVLGVSVDDFLSECIVRGWVGGKAEWMVDKPAQQSRQPQKFDPLAYVNRNRTKNGGGDVIDV